MTRRLWRGDRVSSLLKVLFCTENGRLKRESVHWREPISLIVRERRVCGSGPCFSWYDIICSVIVGFKNMVNVGCRAIRCEYLDNYSIALLQALWNLSSCIILQIAGYNNHIHKDFRLQFIRPISCKKCLCRGWLKCDVHWCERSMRVQSASGDSSVGRRSMFWLFVRCFVGKKTIHWARLDEIVTFSSLSFRDLIKSCKIQLLS